MILSSFKTFFWNVEWEYILHVSYIEILQGVPKKVCSKFIKNSSMKKNDDWSAPGQAIIFLIKHQEYARILVKS